MSLSIRSNAGALIPGLFTYFHASAGVEPYSYAMVPGGAMGTVDSVTGLYTAPSSVGSAPGDNIDTVEVTDDNGDTARATIVVGSSPLELVCDILQRELELDDGQVYLWDQKLLIPKDSKLYVAVGVVDPKPFGSTTIVNSDGDEEQSVNMCTMISVDILSRSTEAVDRKEEVIMALNSLYAQSQQEINSFSIGGISKSFTNLSQQDGAAIPYRFNITAQVTYFATKKKSAPYYDDFEDPEVTTEP